MRSRRRDDPPPARLKALSIERVSIVVREDVHLSSNAWVHLGHVVSWLRAQGPANDQR